MTIQDAIGIAWVKHVFYSDEFAASVKDELNIYWLFYKTKDKIRTVIFRSKLQDGTWFIYDENALTGAIIDGALNRQSLETAMNVAINLTDD